MKNRKLLLVVSLMLALTMSLGGTLAYLTDTDEAVNVMTLGNVKIEQLELQRKDKNKVSGLLTEGELIPFEQGQPLYPAYAENDTSYTAVDSPLLYWGPYTTNESDSTSGGGGAGNGLWPVTLHGALDKMVFVKNTGDSPCFFRTWIAFECPEGMDYSEGSDKEFMNNLNLNWRYNWETCGYDDIEDTRYLILCATSTVPLGVGEISRPSLLQVVMTGNADSKDMELLGDTYEILAFSQAVQTNNFDHIETVKDTEGKVTSCAAMTALEAAFGKATKENHPWDDEDGDGDVIPELPITVAKDAAELRDVLAEGGNVMVAGTMNAIDTVDVPTWSNAPAEFVIDATEVNSLSGGEYVLDEASKYGIVARISAGETLALSDMKVTANSQWPMYLSNYGGTLTVTDVEVEAEAGAGVYPYGTAGTTTLKNVKVNQNRLDPAYASSTPWAATAVATSNGHNLIIESGTYVGSSWAVYGYNSGSTITINGGTFKANKVIQLDGVWSGTNKSVATINGGTFDGAIYLDYGNNAPELYINGGSFTNFSATVNGKAVLSISGGTFDADPSVYVADGYTATQNADDTWTVTAE